MENYDQNTQMTPPPSGYPRLEPHRGTMILVFGILGIVLCGIFAVLAWIFGNTDLRKMDAGTMDAMGREMTNIGKILGMIGVALNILGIVIGIVYAVFVVGIAASNGF